MVTKINKDDVDNNSSKFRCFVDMLTILLAEKLFNQCFFTI